MTTLLTASGQIRVHYNYKLIYRNQNRHASHLCTINLSGSNLEVAGDLILTPVIQYVIYNYIQIVLLPFESEICRGCTRDCPGVLSYTIRESILTFTGVAKRRQIERHRETGGGARDGEDVLLHWKRAHMLERDVIKRR